MEEEAMPSKRIRVNRKKSVAPELEGQCTHEGLLFDRSLYLYDHFTSVAEAKNVAMQCGNGFRYRITYKDKNGTRQVIEGKPQVINTIREISTPPPLRGEQIE